MVGQESVYVRTRDEPIWNHVRKVAKDKNIPHSKVVVVALDYFFKNANVDELL